MTNEFIIKINKDSQGNELSLENMPIEAADALQVFIEALTNFAKQHSNTNGVHLSLKPGSIQTVLAYPADNQVIDNDIQDVLEGNSESAENVKFFNNIFDKIQLNGIDYTVTRKVNGRPQDLTAVFKTKRFAKKKSKVTREEQVVFIHGHIYASGGKVKPNMHIEFGSEDFKVSFQKEQAKKMPGLYEEIFLSAIERVASNTGEKTHEFIDRYLTMELYSEYKELYERVQSTRELERFDWVYDFIEANIKRERIGFGRIIKLMRLYNHAQGDRGVIRTILMTLKPVLGLNEDIEAHFNDLADILKERKQNQII